ncbi:MAG: uroporphyrinogen decarboxylase family protein [Verrucomicrobiota bacterium]
MTNREKLIKTLRREGCKGVPVDFVLCPSQIEAFEKRFGHADYQSWFGLYHREVVVELEAQFEDGRKLYKEELPADTKIDEWGVARSKGSDAAMHMTHMHNPLKGECSMEDIRNYPYPKIKAAERERVTREVEELHAQGLAAVGVMQMTVWEKAWYIRSMEDLMADMMCGEESAELHFDKVTAISCERAAIHAECGCDVIQLGDDIGMQQSIMMSVDLWREWVKPRLVKVVQAAKAVNPDVLIFYHSCGHILPFLEELADAGVEILNPIQPECMNVEDVHARIGDRMSFWGTIGTQQVLPFGTPEQVRAEVRKNLNLCGSQGGIVVAPTHVVEPEVPWENLLALVDECRAWEKARGSVTV